MNKFKQLLIRTYQKILYLATFFLGIKEPKIIKGENSFVELCNLLKEKGNKKVLLVTDSGLHSLNMDKLVYDEFINQGLDYALFYDITANPTVDQVEEARQLGAHGVGLFRTEFLFMNPYSIPGEEEQFEIYKKLLIASGDEPVTIRTMDIGGDKLCSGVSRNVEKNPFLGLRGIRLSLYERKDLFITQIRALMRAGVFGNLRILIPMVSSLIEVQEVKEIISQQHIALHNENINHLGSPALGVMIETPAAALMADKIGALVDFFSIGTNDLVQYTMAIDRENDRVAYLYKPSHPAILQLIKLTVEAAKKNRIFVAVCVKLLQIHLWLHCF
jgi:phosphoenolpyruvate-protein kinase (PTS system EI component)